MKLSVNSDEYKDITKKKKKRNIYYQVKYNL